MGLDGEKKSTVEVHCSIKGGVELRLYELVNDPQAPAPSRPVGPPVTLRQGVNDIDRDFWQKWIAQNEKNPLALNWSIHAAPGAATPEKSK